MNESGLQSVPPTAVVEAFQEAVVTAFSEMAQLVAFPETTSSGTIDVSDGDVVAASIHLLRPLPGTMTLLLSAPTAAKLAARYLPAGTPLTVDLIDDVAGEFANVIAGQAKTMLKGTPYHFTLSTPKVTRAGSFARSPRAEDSGFVALLSCELGRVLIRVELPACPHA